MVWGYSYRTWIDLYLDLYHFLQFSVCFYLQTTPCCRDSSPIPQRPNVPTQRRLLRSLHLHRLPSLGEDDEPLDLRPFLALYKPTQKKQATHGSKSGLRWSRSLRLGLCFRFGLTKSPGNGSIWILKLHGAQKWWKSQKSPGVWSFDPMGPHAPMLFNVSLAGWILICCRLMAPHFFSVLPLKRFCTTMRICLGWIFTFNGKTPTVEALMFKSCGIPIFDGWLTVFRANSPIPTQSTAFTAAFALALALAFPLAYVVKVRWRTEAVSIHFGVTWISFQGHKPGSI